MCGGGVQDNSDKVAAIEAQRAREEADRQERERIRKEAEFGTNLDNSYRSAIESARRYFADQGLDPDQYASAITEAATSKRGTVPKLDSNPAAFFDGLGASVYEQQTANRRNKALRDLSSFAREGFESDRIADTADDSFVNATREEQFLEALGKIEGQKARGTLNDFGFSKAVEDLNRQKVRVGDELQGLGQSVLQKGRTSLAEIANKARSRANSLNLGEDFDPFSYNTQIGTTADDFFASLGDRIKSAAPTNLFDVGAAYQRGGQSQGALNTPYDRNASTGFFSFLDEEEEKKKKQQPVSAF